jgi:SAM-dependent methyltransferase
MNMQAMTVGFNRAIHPEAGPLSQADPEAYFATGHRQTWLIKLCLEAAQRNPPRRILDLPSGYGRVLRSLQAEWPEAEVTACDIHRPAVDFCAQELGAVPVYGTEDPFDLDIGPFDMAWCGSLLTHLDEPGWDRFLGFFENVIPIGGLFVFTVNGPFVAEVAFPGSTAYGADAEMQRAALKAYAQNGFAYFDYRRTQKHDQVSLPKQYGNSLASPTWVCKLLERFKFDLVMYRTGSYSDRWGEAVGALATAEQDVVGCVRRR